MSTFNFDSNNLKSSESIYRSISESFYPGDQMVVKNTSFSAQGAMRERTLTSRTLADAISGEVLFRSPKYASTFYNKTLSSSLNSMITGGSEAAFTTGSIYKIPDPENPEASTTLTGGAAFSRVMLDSVAGKKGASDFVQNAASNITYNSTTIASYPKSTMGGTDADNHSSPDTQNESSLAIGGRPIVLASEISEQELSWLKERAQLVLDSGNIDAPSGVVTGFMFDVPDNVTDIRLLKSRYPEAEGPDKLDPALITAATQKAYIAPALLEFFIYLDSKIVIKGGFGQHRGDDVETQGKNNTPLQSGDYLTDHAMGRGFDIMGVGIKGGEYYDFRLADIDIYRKGLDLLLSTLSSAPQHLIPDFLHVHNGLAPELGLTTKLIDGQQRSAYEDSSAAYRIKYPGLKYINVDGDRFGVHNNHVHVSFYSGRAGYYTGPGGEMGGASPVSTSPSGSENSGITLGGDRAIELQMHNQSMGFQYQSSTEGANTSGGFWTNLTTDLTNFMGFVRNLRNQNPFSPRGPGSGGSNGGDPNFEYSSDLPIPDSLNDAKFTKSYATDTQTSLTEAELFALLRLTCFHDEMAAIFTAISARESNRRPAACTISASSGDWSLGMLQINALPGAQGTKQLWLPKPSPVTGYFWQFAYKNWNTENIGIVATDGLDSTEKVTLKEYMQSKAAELEYNQRYTLVDPIMFIPLNQAYSLYNCLALQEFKGEKLGASPDYKFSPWGDYGSHPYGFIRNVHFKTAASVYTSTGKPLEDLQKWVLDMFAGPGSGSRAAEYAEDWVSGWYFPTIRVDGEVVAGEPVPPSS